MNRLFDRAGHIGALEALEFDILVIGGGASGLGVAVDSASRGYRTGLIESGDFANATSSRSTKLVHGGVRYLEQMQFGLVSEALEERAILCANAPHIAHDLAFVVPRYRWWEGPFYGVGLKLYDALAGKRSIGASRLLSREETIAAIPGASRMFLLGCGVFAALWLAAAGFFFAADLALWHLGIERTTLANSSLLANATSFIYPIWGFAVARTLPSRRAASALMLAVAEMYVKGVSTRDVADILDKFGIDLGPNITLVGPQAYMAFLNLWKDAAVVLTDSGGLQEETTALGVPCITIRENTERPVTVDEGSNVLVGTDPVRIVAEASKVLRGEGKQGRRPHLWDGKAAVRIVEILAKELA